MALKPYTDYMAPVKVSDLIYVPEATKFNFNVTRVKAPTFSMEPREECKVCRKFNKNEGACIKRSHKMDCNQSQWIGPMNRGKRGIAGSMVFSIFERSPYNA